MVTAIVQARMGSKRLPGKILAPICGRPLLWHVINRLSFVPSIEQLVVATSLEPGDDVVVRFCRENRVDCFRGSESDVLDRFYQAAKHYGAEAIVRITADCPLIDPNVVAKVVGAYLSGTHEYVTNTLRYTYPDGQDVEVFSFEALETAWHQARRPQEREHVTPYLRISGRFKALNIENEVDLSARHLRWTVDDPADLAFVRAVYERLGNNGRVFGLDEVLDLLAREPNLMKINADGIRNQGYYASLLQEEMIPEKTLNLAKSHELKKRAVALIPSMSQTFSKGPSQFVQNVSPVFLKKGRGSRIWDADGNQYIDYPMALGPIILGHNYPAVSEAVTRQIQDGTTFSLPHGLEVEVAEMLVEVIPCAEMVRFGKNGSDVTAGAVRAARAYTGRDIIVCCGYHGWQDWYIGSTTRNRGVPAAIQKLTQTFDYNHIGSLERIFSEHPGQVAAVIMEPIGVLKPENGFLEAVQRLVRREGALLIFDEVITGFRLALGGAQEYFGVTPDMACFGKAVANGYPLSAVTGPREIMTLFDEVFFSFTFGGETLSLAAAKATITELKKCKVIERLWEQGLKLKDGYNVLARALGLAGYTECIGLAPRTLMTFKDDTGAESLLLKSYFQQECIKRGILFSGSQLVCFSHSDADIDYTLRVYRTALELLAEAIASGNVEQRLAGEPVAAIFRKP